MATINPSLDIQNHFYSDELSHTYFDTIRLQLPILYFNRSQVGLDIF